MKTHKKFFVMATLFLMGGLVAPNQSKAQKGAPIVTRKSNGQDYTKAEIKAKLSQSGVYWDMVRAEIVNLTNRGLEKSGETLRVKTSNLAWVVDSSEYVPKNEYGDQIENGYTDGKAIKYVTTRKTDGNYLVFKYKKCSVRILDPACLNPQREIFTTFTTKNISETPEVAKTEADEVETTTSDEPCYKEVWKTQQYWAVEKVMYRPANAAGWYTGYYGMDNGYQSYNRRVLKTRKVKVLVPCEETSSNVEDEELPIATRDSETDEETTERVRTKRPVYIFLNGSFVFYRNTARMAGGTVLNTGGPVHTGGLGGPVHTGGAVGGPVYNGGLH